MVLLTNSALDRDHEMVESMPPVPSRAALAWQDLKGGLQRSWMWSALALQDIKLRYRGSVLGPFWLTISMLVMVAGMGLIYARLFSVHIDTYLPYLALGLIIWQFLAALITEGCETFLREQSVIQQVPIPYSTHAYRAVCRNLIVFAHNIAIVPLVMLFFEIVPDWRLIEVIPAVFVLSVNGLWISIGLGLLSTRFRDIPPIVGSFLQVLFFLTPVIWPIDTLGEWRWVATYNPFFAAIDVVRAPFLGTDPVETSWPILLALTLIGGGATFALFARFRERISYWI